MERGIFKFTMPGLTGYWCYADGLVFTKIGLVRKGMELVDGEFCYNLKNDKGQLEYVAKAEIIQYGKHLLHVYSKHLSYYNKDGQTVGKTIKIRKYGNAID